MLSDRVIASFARLGITIVQSEGQSLQDAIMSIDGAHRPYEVTPPKFIEMVEAHGVRGQFDLSADDDLSGMDEDEINDYMPLICSFYFSPHDGMDDFDTDQFILLANDCYHFFLLRHDDTSPDPAIYMLDHEEMDEEPWTEFTLGQLLDMLEPEAED